MKRLLAIKKRKRYTALWLFLFLIPLASMNLYAYDVESQILKKPVLRFNSKEARSMLPLPNYRKPAGFLLLTTGKH